MRNSILYALLLCSGFAFGQGYPVVNPSTVTNGKVIVHSDNGIKGVLLDSLVGGGGTVNTLYNASDTLFANLVTHVNNSWTTKYLNGSNAFVISEGDGSVTLTGYTSGSKGRVRVEQGYASIGNDSVSIITGKYGAVDTLLIFDNRFNKRGLQYANDYSAGFTARSLVDKGYVDNAVASNYFKKDGNSFGSVATLGTNDNFDLSLETNNTTAVTINTSQNVGVGTTSPSARLHALSTTEQLRLGYDASNYASFTTASDGNLTIGLTGTTAKTLTFSGDKKEANGTRYLYVPEQTGLSGSIVFGNGGLSLTHTTGVTGQNNTLVGINAGNAVTSASDNTLVGKDAGKTINTGSFNTGLGSGVLNSTTSGTNNVAIGALSLFLNTSGANNIGIGFQTLYNNTIGFGNIGIGTQALINSQTGNYNVATGFTALNAVNTGSGNTAYGGNALQNVTTGNYNIGIGYNTGLGITSGSNNTIIGSNITGLPSALNNNIIIADGGGNQRIRINDLGEAGLDMQPVSGFKLAVNGAARTGGQLQVRGAGNTAGLTSSVLRFFNTTTSGSMDLLLNNSDRLEFIGNLGTTVMSVAPTEVNVNASLVGKTTVVNTSSYTLGSTDLYLEVDASGGNVTIDITPAAANRVIYITRIDNSANQINFTGTINGVVNPTGLTELSTQYSSITLKNNSSDTGFYIF